MVMVTHVSLIRPLSFLRITRPAAEVVVIVTSVVVGVLVVGAAVVVVFFLVRRRQRNGQGLMAPLTEHAHA